MTENKYCKCGQPINVEHDSKNTCRRDGLRFYVPEEKHPGSCLFRCPECSRVVEYDDLVELGLLDDFSECPNVYCPNQKNNKCGNYIGLPIECKSRDRYISDNCPNKEEYDRWKL